MWFWNLRNAELFNYLTILRLCKYGINILLDPKQSETTNVSLIVGIVLLVIICLIMASAVISALVILNVSK